MDVLVFWEQGVSIVWTAFPDLKPQTWFPLYFRMTERQPAWTGFLNNKLDACVSKYLYGACSVVSIKRYLHERDQISLSAEKEMALDVAPCCKQLKVFALLLVYLSTSILACPQVCQCGSDGVMKYAECSLNSMKNIPTGFPADTTTLWVYHKFICSPSV